MGGSYLSREKLGSAKLRKRCQLNRWRQESTFLAPLF